MDSMDSSSACSIQYSSVPKGKEGAGWSAIVRASLPPIPNPFLSSAFIGTTMAMLRTENNLKIERNFHEGY
jgi:hypothetical protein